MKTVRFTQSINLSVTVEAQIPEDWDSDTFAEEFIVKLTVDEPDDPADNGIGCIISELMLDGAETTDTTVWSA